MIMIIENQRIVKKLFIFKKKFNIVIVIFLESKKTSEKEKIATFVIKEFFTESLT